MEIFNKKMNNSFSVIFTTRKTRTSNDEKVIIYVRITLNSQRVEMSTGLKIEANKWCEITKRAKGSSEQSKTINSCLGDINNNIYQVYAMLLGNGNAISVYDIKKHYLGNPEEEKRITIMEIFDRFIAIRKDLVNIEYSHATYQRYCTLKGHLLEFLDKKLNVHDVAVEDFKFSNLMEFEHFLRIDKGIANNTAVKYIRHFRTVIGYALNTEMIDKDPYVKYKGKIREVKRGYLSMEELTVLEAKDFSNPRLAMVKDIFVFCCYTGLAYIDIKMLTIDQISMGIDGEQWVNTSRKKTGNGVDVPLLPAALRIIKKYNGHPAREIDRKVLPVLSNQKMNAYLKEIGDICGLSKTLTTHLARHTFATTITLTQGISMESVSKMLGHSDIKTTQIYAKVTNQKILGEMVKLRELTTQWPDENDSNDDSQQIQKII
jgi:site-specific recombinase XerD